MRLFAKLAVILVAIGALGLGLLSLRQQRYEVSNQISKAHNRIVEQERTQWRMRAEVAKRVDPADIRGYAERLNLELAPIQPGSAATAATAVTKPVPKAASRSPARVR
jgi:cell division protein FtsL